MPGACVLRRACVHARTRVALPTHHVRALQDVGRMHAVPAACACAHVCLSPRPLAVPLHILWRITLPPHARCHLRLEPAWGGPRSPAARFALPCQDCLCRRLPTTNRQRTSQLVWTSRLAMWTLGSQDPFKRPSQRGRLRRKLATGEAAPAHRRRRHVGAPAASICVICEINMLRYPPRHAAAAPRCPGAPAKFVPRRLATTRTASRS